jgi:predicted permease
MTTWRTLLAVAVRLLPNALRSRVAAEIVALGLTRIQAARPGWARTRTGLRELFGIVHAAVRARRPDNWTRRTAALAASNPAGESLMPDRISLSRVIPRWNDIRIALRMPATQWRLAWGVILTLSLGVGLGVPVLGLADTMFLRPPTGVTDPDRVVRLVLRGHGTSGPYYTQGLTGLDYAVLRERATALEAVAGWISFNASLGTGEGAHSITTVQATPSYFAALGVRPHAGRFYLESEDFDGNTNPPCVISHHFWQGELGGAPDAIGRRLRIGAQTYTVVGIAPEGFNGLTLGAVDVWLPLHVAAPEWQGHEPELWTTDRSSWIRIVARIRPGVSIDEATAEAALLYRTSGERTRDPQLRGSLLWDPVQPGRSTVGSRSATLTLWLGGGGLLLLAMIAANVTNLFRVRAIARERQTAIRLAVGGTWHDLLRSFLAESFVLGVIASAIGLAFSVPATRAARVLLFPRVEWVLPAIDLRIVLLAFALAVAIGTFVALWSTLQALRSDPAELLRGGSAKESRRRSALGFRSPLLAFQAAVFTILLAGAAAFVGSLQRATAIDVGFDIASLGSGRIPLPAGTPVSRTRDLMLQARERVAAMPGIASASLGYMEPWSNNVELPVEVPGSSVEPPWILFDYATPEYLETFGATMRAGRWISTEDHAGSTPVIVINEALEKVFWSPDKAIGNCIRVGGDTMPCRTIIGVVRDFKVTGGIEDPVRPVYYLPFAQVAWASQRPTLFFRARAGHTPESVTPAVRYALQTLEPGLQAASVRPTARNVEWVTSPLKLGASVFVAFGILAAVVGSVGLFSVLSFVVVEQRRRHAVQLALGATPALVGRSIGRFAVMVTGTGVALGLIALVPLARLIDPLLFRTRILDPSALLAVAVLGLLLALTAAAMPIRAIYRMQVMTTLRE